MKHVLHLLPALLVLSSLAAAAEPRDLLSTARADRRLTTFARTVTTAGLTEVLEAPGPLTVFAPTDEAFAALPPGALDALIRDPDALAGVLRHHVLREQVLARDLLPVPTVRSLDGSTLELGLRVGKAQVVQADLRCSNGVIHLIDRVLLPSLPAPGRERAAAPTRPIDVLATLRAAIDRGAPQFNEGHLEACVRIYRDAAAALVGADGALSPWDRLHLTEVLAKPAADARAQAWALRRAFDAILANETFELRAEAELPADFPAPGPVGHVVVKRYPRYRAARAAGGTLAFWTLFRHIKQNGIEMTAPVEMTMDGALRARDMAFLYGRPDQGNAGQRGNVDVLDLDARTVLSIGVRGARSEANMARAKGLLEENMRDHGYTRDGEYRVLGYNSPMVPTERQYWEFQVPVRR